MSLKYFTKRFIYAVITVFFVIVFNYFLFRLLPGDPLTMLMRSPRITADAIEGIRAFYGLDMPWWQQFFLYIKNLFQGDLGMSFTYKAPVTSVIGARLWPTISLLFTSIALSVVVGIAMGTIAGWKRGKKTDLGVMSFSLVLYSMPPFWLGMLMLVIFSVKLRLFPVSGMITPGMRYLTTTSMARDFLRHFFLPAAVLTLTYIAEFAIITRNTLTDVLSEDYILTAKAKGFKDGYILKNHAFPNARLPVMTLAMIHLGLVVGGAIQVETIFSWPGIGRLMFEAIFARDYPLLQGIFLLSTICVIAANFLADISYVYLDPRVKLK